VHDGGAHGRLAVGGDGDADAGAADQHPPPGLAVADRPGHGRAEIRVIDRRCRGGAEVDDPMAGGLQLPLQEFLEVETGVVGGNGYGLGRHRHADPTSVGGAGTDTISRRLVPISHKNLACR
jgi:hypothetical protein